MKELNRETENEMDLRTYLFYVIISLPFWFFSSCERSYYWYETAYHIEINIGIPLILFILITVFHIKSKHTKYLMDRIKYQNIANYIFFIGGLASIIFSILNLFSLLDWFHNFFPIF